MPYDPSREPARRRYRICNSEDEIYKPNMHTCVYNSAGEYIELSRIQATEDIPGTYPPVHKGDYGGYVESYDNLKQEVYLNCDGEMEHPTCWIYDNAKVYDNAVVFGYASIRDRADVSGYFPHPLKPKTLFRTTVAGHAEIGGTVEIKSGAMVGDNTHIGHMAVIENYASIGGDSKIDVEVSPWFSHISGHFEITDVDFDGVRCETPFNYRDKKTYEPKYIRNITATDKTFRETTIKMPDGTISHRSPYAPAQPPAEHVCLDPTDKRYLRVPISKFRKYLPTDRTATTKDVENVIDTAFCFYDKFLEWQKQKHAAPAADTDKSGNDNHSDGTPPIGGDGR